MSNTGIRAVAFGTLVLVISISAFAGGFGNGRGKGSGNAFGNRAGSASGSGGSLSSRGATRRSERASPRAAAAWERSNRPLKTSGHTAPKSRAEAASSRAQQQASPAGAVSQTTAPAEPAGDEAGEPAELSNNQRILDKRLNQAQHLEDISARNGNERLLETSERMKQSAQTNYTRRAERQSAADGDAEITPPAESAGSDAEADVKKPTLRGKMKSLLPSRPKAKPATSDSE